MARGAESTITSIDSEDLRRILVQGRRALEDNVESINALNVFPVPDGDTGTNMLLTMKALEEEPANIGGPISPGSVTAMARGALLGARGNSGVILAQFFQGLARGLDGIDRFSTLDLASALAEGSAAAYKAVGNPVEGTMLTVIREMAEAARQEADRGVDVIEMWDAVCQAARKSVAKTPTLLPVLREAGVVDAGGLGLSVIMEGALSGLREEELGAIELTAPELDVNAATTQAVSEVFIDATEEDLYGYCTQFLIQGEGLNPDDVREQMESLAGSTVVIGGDGRGQNTRPRRGSRPGGQLRGVTGHSVPGEHRQHGRAAPGVRGCASREAGASAGGSPRDSLRRGPRGCFPRFRRRLRALRRRHHEPQYPRDTGRRGGCRRGACYPPSQQSKYSRGGGAGALPLAQAGNGHSDGEHTPRHIRSAVLQSAAGFREEREGTWSSLSRRSCPAPSATPRETRSWAGSR